MVFRIQHFIRTGKSGLICCALVEPANGKDAFEHISGLIGIRLMEHSLVSGPYCARFIGIDSRNDDDLIRYFVLNRAKS